MPATSASYAALLRCCRNPNSLRDGKRVHARIIRDGLDCNTFLCNLLVQMYGRCARAEHARQVFCKMPQRNAFSWNIMIQAYVQNGHVELARRVLDEMPHPNVVSWTAMIAGYSQNGCDHEALELFGQMRLKGVVPNEITFVSVLGACAHLATLAEGKENHASVVDSGFESDVVVGNALVKMYGKCGRLDDARSVFDRMARRDVVSWTSMMAVYAQNGRAQEARVVFDEMPQRDVVSWNAMIGAYSRNGHGKEAIHLFREMQLRGVEPNKVTFISILDACASLAALADGKESHASVVESGFETDVVMGNALVNLYGKCRCLDDAKSLFDKMPDRDVVSWNTMIASCTRNGHSTEALHLFQQLQLTSVKPNNVTFVSVLDAASCLVALAQGKECHATIVDSGFDTDGLVGTALVSMYGKCGSLKDARSVFDRIPYDSVVSWTAMIAAYAHNGYGKEGVEIFREMQLKGMKPDKATFISILFACSHSGLVDDGRYYFVSLNKDYAIIPAVEHFVCMIDLLGRAGQLVEAEDVVNNMPFQPYALAWLTFLGACRIHTDMERGPHAAEHVFELDPNNSAPFALLSNIYAAAGKWDDEAKVRKMMKHRDVKKKPGCSCIMVNKRVYEFVVGDTSHPLEEEIYAELQSLSRQMEEAGYVPDTKSALRDVKEENKQNMLYYHSEKLAIAFGLIATPPGTPLHITKNLRVCSDCHAATKVISKIVNRKIIVRDANRFHHFEHGVCLCGDYW